MSKYVAFLDVLGFKSKLTQLGQESAKKYISAFSATAYHEWEQFRPNLVKGYIVSDSFIIYSDNTTRQSLTELLTIIDKICKKEFSENKILIRGAIAKGEFERMPATELSNLSKGLMVGQAYVDAYTLESAAKVASILVTPEVYADIGELEGQFVCTEEKEPGGSNYIMRYLDYEYLSKMENLQTFVTLAAEARWKPHYFNTLYFAIKEEKNSRKFANLIDSILICIGDPSECWQEIDKFIKNTFDKDVAPEFQKRFLKFLRERIATPKALRKPENIRPSNRERVLQFIEERGNLTISQISSTLGLSHSATARIVQSLADEGMVERSATGIETHGTVGRSVSTYSKKA